MIDSIMVVNSSKIRRNNVVWFPHNRGLLQKFERVTFRMKISKNCPTFRLIIWFIIYARNDGVITRKENPCTPHCEMKAIYCGSLGMQIRSYAKLYRIGIMISRPKQLQNIVELTVRIIISLWSIFFSINFIKYFPRLINSFIDTVNSFHKIKWKQFY